MITAKLAWGPASLGSWLGMTNDPNLDHYDLNDLDDAVAFVFCVPRTGIITKIGWYQADQGGTPPNYYTGLVQMHATLSHPTITPYGGSTITTYVPSGVGWKEFTLGTPAAATVGDVVAVHVWPTIIAPTAINYIAVNHVASVNLDNGGLPRPMWYSSTWIATEGFASYMVEYSDGVRVGLPIIAETSDFYDSADTPDEVGNVLTMPMAATCYGARVAIDEYDTDASCEIRLYDSLDNVLGFCIIDDLDNLSYPGLADLHWPPVSLINGGIYRLTILATHAGNRLYPGGLVFESAGSRLTVPEGSNWMKTERTNLGAWADNSDALMWSALLLSEFEL